MTDPEQTREIAVRGAAIIGGLFLAGPAVIAAVRTLARRNVRPAPASNGSAAPASAAGSRASGVPLYLRFGTLVGVTAGFLVPAYLGEVPFALLVLAVVAVGLGEFFALLEASGIRPYRVSGWLCGAALVVAAQVFGPASLGAVLAASFLVLLGAGALAGDRQAIAARAGGTLLGVLFVAFLGAFLVLIRRSPKGFGEILFFYCVIEFHDVFSLFGGLVAGRHKLAPSLSPGKTWEGTAAGVLAALGGAALFRFALPDLPLSRVLALGAALVPASLLGGLVASALKRGAGLKDFGRILPGHGGILDRFDSSLFSAPVAWLLVRWFERGGIPW